MFFIKIVLGYVLYLKILKLFFKIFISFFNFFSLIVLYILMKYCFFCFFRFFLDVDLFLVVFRVCINLIGFRYWDCFLLYG